MPKWGKSCLKAVKNGAITQLRRPMSGSQFGRFVVASVLFLVLPVSPITAANAPIERMLENNFLFRGGTAMCSATLLSGAKNLVLTNAHCVESSIVHVKREERQPDGTVKEITREIWEEVSLYRFEYGTDGVVGRQELLAEIVAVDLVRDLALLGIKAETVKLPKGAVIPGDSYKLAVGDTIFVVGNPLGEENTITTGIVSHLYRTQKWDADRVSYYIQLDAAAAGGSSGGAVYDTEGRLVGLLSAGYRGTPIHFAIPIRVIKNFLRENKWEELWTKE